MRVIAISVLLLVASACGAATDVVIIQSDTDGDDRVASEPFTEVATEPTVTVEEHADAGPTATFLPPEADAVAHGLGDLTFDLPACPDTPRGAVTDKANQRYWLCMDGRAVTDEIPMTTASRNYGLPPVGTYEVFARDEDATGIGGEALERFVAFYTTPKGNRIAFHEVVDQDPDTVGDLEQRGASAGCFRVREEDSIQVWDFLQIGDPVVVLTN